MREAKLRWELCFRERRCWWDPPIVVEATLNKRSGTLIRAMFPRIRRLMRSSKTGKSNFGQKKQNFMRTMLPQTWLLMRSFKTGIVELGWQKWYVNESCFLRMNKLIRSSNRGQFEWKNRNLSGSYVSKHKGFDEIPRPCNRQTLIREAKFRWEQCFENQEVDEILEYW